MKRTNTWIIVMFVVVGVVCVSLFIGLVVGTGSSANDYSDQLAEEIHIREKLNHEDCEVVVTDVKQDLSSSDCLVCVTVQFTNHTNYNKVYDSSELKLIKATDEYENKTEYSYTINENDVVCLANSTTTEDIYFKPKYSIMSGDVLFIIEENRGLLVSSPTGRIRLKYKDTDKQIINTKIELPKKKVYGIGNPQKIWEPDITVTVTDVKNIKSFRIGSTNVTTDYNFVVVCFTIKNDSSGNYTTADPDDCYIECCGDIYRPKMEYTDRFVEGYDWGITIGAKMQKEFILIFEMPYETTNYDCTFTINTIDELLSAKFLKFEL